MQKFLAIPGFKGLKKLTLDHCVYFTYYLVTVLSLRNRIRNIFSERQLYQIQVFCTKYVHDFFREFGTLSQNVLKFGNEFETKETMELVKKFIAELSSEKREMLINMFNNNMDRVRYIYSSCYISYFYQTSPEGVNTKLEVDNCIRASRKRKLNNIILEKNAANTMKSGQEPSEERKPPNE